MRWVGVVLASAALLGCEEDSETATSTTSTTSTTASVGAGGAGGEGTGAGGTGGAPECNVPEDCPMRGACEERTCIAGMCGVSALPAGTPTANQTPNDCKEEQCDGMGGVTLANDDADLPEDNNDCTDDICTNGVPSHPNTMGGMTCATGVCDGAGMCVGCLVATDCPGNDTECQTRTCDTNNTCGVSNTAQGFVVSNQMAQDCKQNQCDGMGNEVSVNDDLDPIVDNNECTDDLCSMGIASNPPSAVGAPCTQMGQVCDGGGACVECVDDTQCGGGTCVLTECAPDVVATVPADSASNVDVGTDIVITFSEAMDPATLTAQTTAGPCTGSIQLSRDNFTTCLAFGSSAPAMSSGDSVATLVPAIPLTYGLIYQLRITVAATDTTNLPLQSDVTIAFSTPMPPAICDGSIVISQVYGGGGNSGALFTHDFIELHNRGNEPVTLDGWSVQYASATGSSWQVSELVGTIPANGYYLIREGGGTSGGPLPTPDVIDVTAMSSTAGKVALVVGTVALTGTCPTNGVIDFVGYGATSVSPPNCVEGTTAAPLLGNTIAAHRDVAGCRDGDANHLDFVGSAPSPRNSAAAPAICACPTDVVQNETNAALEADYCNLQFPFTTTATQKTLTTTIYGRIFEAGVTEAPGASSFVLAQLGYGLADPTAQLDWVFVPASFNVQVGNDDEYQATILAPAIGTSAVDYDYTLRFSLDGGDSWTYCDSDGAGSNAPLAFDPALVGILTVTP